METRAFIDLVIFEESKLGKFIKVFIEAHEYPVHLNVSQFFSWKRMVVNVMGIDFGLVHANGRIYTLQVVGHQV